MLNEKINFKEVAFRRNMSETVYNLIVGTKGNERMEIAVTELLRYMGGNRTYKGFAMTVTACVLLHEDLGRIRVLHNLYPLIAEKFNCNRFTVERNMRTLVRHIWDEYPDRLREIVGLELTYPPRVSEFLDYLVSYVEREFSEKVFPPK